MCFGRAIYDKARYSEKYDVRQKVQNIIAVAQQANSELEAQKSKEPAFEAVIQKELEPFKYRSIIPAFYQTILSALPNEKNNPEQKELYRAFANGDVETILKTPRKERKQMFITGVSAYFTRDIEKAAFGESNIDRGKGGKKKVVDLGGESEFTVDDSMIGAAKRAASERTKTFTLQGAAEGPSTSEQTLAGFVVTIAGYSPYKNIAELMDPIGVGSDKTKWGVITRMMHLGDPNDPNFPFELYKKAEIQHFKLEIGEVSTDAADMPTGVGVESVKVDNSKKNMDLMMLKETILVDPMTSEVISKGIDFDEDGRKKIDRSGKVLYQVNDHWFVLSAKFAWKNAPKLPD
jgi:hypothetical protein